ncbi:hypothetical protein E2C01_083952 [Portunus trituberculatus]|uniref:VWFD domain-containing protein n=1 Tax=Portunus trituberculatus TaxID=210409 RepID=A0A5B7J9E0_PORTR|nr:hypothetical protein [Portunus trituberculatus]
MGSGKNYHYHSWQQEKHSTEKGRKVWTVLVCPHRLDVWASASLLNQLGGLCGNYDGSLINEFQSRSGTNYDTNPWPIAFPSAVSTTSCKDLGRRINAVSV